MCDIKNMHARIYCAGMYTYSICAYASAYASAYATYEVEFWEKLMFDFLKIIIIYRWVQVRYGLSCYEQS